jgi:predicted nucleotidyltransferase component of viral defense system
MIPRPYIAAWQEYAPWKPFSQIEQDLVISRTLVALFSDDFLRENLAFRGGTALHKLYHIQFSNFLTTKRNSKNLTTLQDNKDKSRLLH